MPRLLFLHPARADHPAWGEADVEVVMVAEIPEPPALADVAGVVVAGPLDADGVAAALAAVDKAAAPAPFLALLGGDGEVHDDVDTVIRPEDLSAGLVRHLLSHGPKAADRRRRLQLTVRALDQAVMSDALTGLGTRALFLRELERHVSISTRNDSRFVLVVMDVDGLRVINQTYGPIGGDRVLTALGTRLSSMLRGADTAFRVGGDEFAALITTGVNSYGVETLARRVIREMALPVSIGHDVVSVRVSIGIGFCPDHGRDARTLLQRIDEALARARRHETGFAVVDVG